MPRREVQRAPGILLLYHRPSRLVADASTVRESIGAFQRWSRHPVTEVNTNLGFPRGLAKLEFDVIVSHYSIFCHGPNPYLLDQGFRDYLQASSAYKVAIFQDEYHWCGRRFAFLDRHRFDCVYTCVEPRFFADTYGRYSGVKKIVSYLPGYVSEELVAAAERFAVPEADRATDIGYRGRPLSPTLGRGGQEKTEIGARFMELDGGSGLVLDIDLTEEGRIYGEDWYRFIASCRGILGVESGASCYDLEDEVLADAQRLEATGEQVTIEALERGAMARWDGRYPIRTISPRHFEAAAFGVTQILFEGAYSGAMRPMEHYIPLRKDFGDLDLALERFRDNELRAELTANARRDLVDSGEYGYEGLIERFDGTLAEAGIEPSPRIASRSVRAATRGRPPGPVALHHVGGVWWWLRGNHPAVWSVLHVASRPLVWLVMLLYRVAGRLRRRGARHAY